MDGPRSTAFLDVAVAVAATYIAAESERTSEIGGRRERGKKKRLEEDWSDLLLSRVVLLQLLLLQQRKERSMASLPTDERADIRLHTPGNGEL